MASNASTKIVPITWDDAKGEIVWLDNAQIPWKEVYVSSKDIGRLATAIKGLEIRGAPVLGEAGAYGIALAAGNAPNSADAILKSVKDNADTLVKTRPTAVNLAWGINKIVKAVESAVSRGESPTRIKEIALKEAKKVQSENIAATMKIGKFGKDLINDGDVLMTVCNAGALACDGLGTSTAPLRAAWAEGKRFKVLVTYTAPLYQGARLTAWELQKDGIPIKVITDNATGHLIREEKVTAAWAGADRILANGNVYNKIGTYNLGILLKHHNGKLYVAAPTSTIDPVTKVEDVRIEQRDQDEVRTIMGKVRIVPEGVETLNPAFDRTPPELVSAIVTELGIARAPYDKSIAELVAKEGSMVSSR
jgi:eIF-2B alpha/beta/delta-like uncharacterized protein